ncbi:hypothetical protein BURKHO8Y_110436 [Burkholderia sp. 8Y]|nr:hypothetical protein BURKHO8Y_110436 [Burkholderia sp. 8Y]
MRSPKSDRRAASALRCDRRRRAARSEALRGPPAALSGLADGVSNAAPLPENRRALRGAERNAGRVVGGFGRSQATGQTPRLYSKSVRFTQRRAECQTRLGCLGALANGVSNAALLRENRRDLRGADRNAGLTVGSFGRARGRRARRRFTRNRRALRSAERNARRVLAARAR